MSSDSASYRSLCDHVQQTALLRSTLALLEWDQQTMLPAGGTEYRSDQIAYLSSLIHERSTCQQLGDWLAEAADSVIAQDSESDEFVTVQRLQRDYDRATRLPSDLVQALARATSKGQACWIEARKADDFSQFAPQLKTIVQLKQQQADALGYADERYDALLDEYEPEAKTTEVAQVLDSLCRELVPLVEQLGERTNVVNPELLRRHFPVDAQRKFGREASAAIGFDYHRGRVDVTHHPFCTELGPDDCRITTRYDESFFNSAFFGTLHEAGHGIYEQGLRSDQYGLPLGSYCSLGIHESQSRLWENLVGRSNAFWEHFFPRAQACFPAALSDVSPGEFYAAVNYVAPSLIRVEADEATYNLHIVLRFELERALLQEELPVDDLPTAWNQKYREYLGVEPTSDAVGVLQDIHWSAGLFGYFPTYSLGNLYASQLFAAAEESLGDLSGAFRNGEFQPLKQWLNEKVHSPGRRWSSPELVERICGEPLSSKYLIQQLKRKYEQIYQFEFAN